VKSTKLFSVVICTYNRGELARDAVASVVAQDFPSERYEVLIVDNGSTDHTREMAKEFCEACPGVRYVFEGNVGLSHARNRGWREARGEYIAYIDDDCKIPPSWLSAAAKVIEQEHPAALGGPFYACYNVPKPVWFKDEYGSRVQGTEVRPLMDGEYLDGMNMFIRADALRELGGFNPDFGMKGMTIGYGEETELINRLRNSGGTIYYAPEVFVYHLVHADKMGLWTNMRMNFWGGYYYSMMSHQPVHGNLSSPTWR
jgi:glycosyltransferase involved in cell wall biosynthesis